MLGDSNEEKTVIAETFIQAGVIPIEKLQDLIEKQKAKAIDQEVEFFQSLAYFSNWSKRMISKILPNFEKVETSHKQRIIQEGKSSKHIYFVRDGEFEITQRKEIK